MSRPRARRGGRLAVALLCLLIVLGAGFAGVGGGAPESAADRAIPGAAIDGPAAPWTPQQSAGYEAIVATHRFFLTPSEPGLIDIRIEYAIPEAVERLQIRLPADATATQRRGFERTGDRTFEWDRNRGTPSVTMTVPANRTTEREGPIAASGDLLFVDAGDWALVTRPTIVTDWSWHGAGVVGFERRMIPETPGATGETMAFLGPHTVDEREAQGQTFVLVVPEAADSADTPDRIHGAMADAADRLRIGARDERVFMVVAPTDDVPWAVRGLQVDAADMWVRDRDRVEDVEGVWVHEYVHTRQGFETSEAVRWMREGTAVYYAVLFGLERGDVSFDRFNDRLAVGTRTPHHDDVLAEPGTWTRHPDYFKGALVAGTLDRRIREATDGERSLQDVLRAMNAHDGVVDQRTFLRMVERVGGADVRAEARRYTETSAVPSMWSETDHRRTFGQTPARFDIGLRTTPAPVDITGPYRNRSVRLPDPLVLVPGETIAIHAVVENHGGATGTYNESLRVDGSEVATEEGSLEPGERRAVTFNRTFGEPGTYRVRVADRSFRVIVVRPADASARSLSIEPVEPTVGESVTVAVMVENAAEIPGEADLGLTVDGRERERLQVQLDVGQTAVHTFETTFDRAGRHDVAVGGVSRTVVVQEEAEASSERENDIEDRDDTGPGDGTGEEDTTDRPVPLDGPGPLLASLSVLLVVIAAGLAGRRS